MKIFAMLVTLSAAVALARAQTPADPPATWMDAISVDGTATVEA